MLSNYLKVDFKNRGLFDFTSIHKIKNKLMMKMLNIRKLTDLNQTEIVNVNLKFKIYFKHCLFNQQSFI